MLQVLVFVVSVGPLYIMVVTLVEQSLPQGWGIKQMIRAAPSLHVTQTAYQAYQGNNNWVLTIAENTLKYTKYTDTRFISTRVALAPFPGAVEVLL